MKQSRIIAAAFCTALLLTACQHDAHPKGGEYTTAHFTFTVPDSCKLLEKEEHSYSPYLIYTFCSTDDETCTFTVSESDQHAAPRALAEDWSDADIVNEITGTPFPAWYSSSETEKDGTAVRMLRTHTGCEGKTLSFIAQLPEKDEAWYHQTVKDMLATVQYTGEALQGGSFQSEWLTVSYSEDWSLYEGLPDEASDADIMLVRSNAQTADQLYDSVHFRHLPEETLSPAEYARQLYEQESDLRRERQLYEAELFGQACHVYSFILCPEGETVQDDNTRFTYYYFTHKDQLFQIGLMSRGYLHGALLADAKRGLMPEF